MARALLRQGFGLTLVAAAFAAGCFTDPINMPPSIRIGVDVSDGSPPGPIFRGDKVTYIAKVSDPDNGGGTSRLEWAVTPKECPPGIYDPVNWPSAEAWRSEPEDKKVVTVGPSGPFCVWAKAIDGSGAVGVDAVTCDPRDHAPSLQLVQVAPPPADGGTFPPNTEFVFSAAGVSDQDEGDDKYLSVSWALKPDSVDGGVLGPCGDDGNDKDPFKRCFKATAVGNYVVAATVSDAVDGGVDGSASTFTDSVTVVVVPGPPPVAAISIESFTPPDLHSDDDFYALGATFRLSSANSHRADGDHEVKPHWISFKRPDEAKPETGDLSRYSCGSNDGLLCFTADVPGTYTVELAVDDGFSTSTSVSKDIKVAPDQPPCIKTSTLSVVPREDPETIIPLTANEIRLSEVQDDRDPFPGFKAIAWFVQEPSGNGGAPIFVYRGEFETLPLKDEGRAGDVVKVRLEVHDRDLEASNRDFVACGGAATCSLPNVFFRSCSQRMTFNLRLLGQ